MKRIIILLILSLYLFPSVYAQQGWQWGKQVEINTYDMAVDNHGNSYILWNVDRDYDVDGHTIHPFKAIWYGGPSIAVTSFTCDGTYRWTKVIGSKQTTCVGLAIGTDTLGGVYAWCGITTDSTDTVFVDQDTIVLPTRRRLLLVKFNSNGDFQWYRQPSTQEPASPQFETNTPGFRNMDVTPQGEVYLSCILPPGTYGDGSFIATLPYNSDSASGRCLYVLKYDRNGNFDEGIHLDMFFQGGAESYNIRREPTTGNFYLSSHRYDAVVPVEITFGSNTPVTKTQFLGCFDSTGAFKWMQQNSNTDLYSTNGGRTAFDKAGNIYFTGGTDSEDSWGGHVISIDTPYHYLYPFLLKFSPQGEVLNATNAIAYGSDYGRAIAYSNNIVSLSMGLGWDLKWGNIEATRPQSDQGADVLLARFNAANLEPIGLEHITSSNYSNEYGTVLATDNKGSFYMGGTFDAAMYIGPDTIYNQSSPTDGFIAKFGFANCHCDPPAAHYSHNGLLSGGTITFNYDGGQPVDSVIWNFGDGSSSTSINNLNINHDFVQDGRYMVCAIAYNSCGSNMYCEELAVGDVGITEIPGFSDISVYPNPATQTLTVSGASAGTRLGIYDALGRLMQQSVLKGGKDQIDVRRLSPGIYLMRFTDKDGKRGNVKFVKE